MGEEPDGSVLNHPHGHSPRSSWIIRVVVEFCSTVATIFLIELIIHIVNPFGVDEAIERRAAQVIQKVAASAYGGTDINGTLGQRSVTVVMIDRRFAAQAAAVPGASAPSTEPVWPLPVSTLMLGVVKRILREHPAALFIDLSLPYAPRESAPGKAADIKKTMEALGDHLADIDQDPSGVPVFLSDVMQMSHEQEAEGDGCPRDYIPNEDISKSSMLARALRERVFNGAPSGNLAMVDSAVLTPEGAYQLAPAASGPRGSCRDQANAKSGYIPSPALALFAALCPNPNSTNRKPQAAKICGRPDVAKLAKLITVSNHRDESGMRLYDLAPPADKAMELRWGANLTQNVKNAYAHAEGRDRCFNQFNPSPFEPVLLFGIMAIAPLERSLEKVTVRPCVYIDTIAPDDLDARFRSPTGPSNGAAPTGVVERDFASSFIKDRIVLLGVNLTQAGDSYVSPVNGNIPGVYVHAAAIENLLTRGVRFARAEPQMLWWFAVILIDAFAYVISRITIFWLFKYTKTLPSIVEIIINILAYVSILVVTGAILIVALANTDLSLVEVALPLAALHLLLLAKLADRFEERVKERLEMGLEKWLGKRGRLAPIMSRWGSRRRSAIQIVIWRRSSSDDQPNLP